MTEEGFCTSCQVLRMQLRAQPYLVSIYEGPGFWELYGPLAAIAAFAVGTLFGHFVL